MHRTTIVIAAALAIAPAAHAAPAARTFDLVTYTAPDGFTVDASAADHVVIQRVGAKSYCVIGIYASTDAAADLDASFAAAWRDIYPHSIDPVAAPTATHATIGGAPAALGAVMSTTDGKPVLVMLTTIDAGSKVVSILVLTPNQKDLEVYTPSITSLLNSLSIRRVDSSPAPEPAPVDNTRPGPPPRTLAVADLGGEWKHDDGAFSNYVSASSGAYAGYNAIQTSEKWTIDAKKATVATVFHGTSVSSGGGYQVNEKHNYKITLGADGELVLADKGGSKTHYLVRGWKVTPELTFLVINGPYVDVPIPDQIRNEPTYGFNLDETWVRVTPPSK
jgi:hypothetical protein